MGGTLTKLALVSRDGRILAERRIPALAHRDPAQALREVRAEIEQMAASAGLAYPPPDGCGIGVPGVVDYRTGRLIFCGALGWREVALGELAREALGCETAVDTDVNAGALADLYFGCARESSDLLYISWGTGIGAGLVISRKLYHTRGAAMCNFGHMPADPSSARRCYCGCHGCLEIEAGGRAMANEARERLAAGEESLLRQQPEVTPERIAWAASHGDALARSILDRSALLMARVLGGVLALLNPDTIVFGGGVSRCFPLIQDTFDAELRARTPDFSIHLTAIRQSRFSDNAGVVGAAMLVRTGP